MPNVETKRGRVHVKDDWEDGIEPRTEEGKLRQRRQHRAANLTPEQLANRRRRNAEAVARYNAKVKGT
jgi:hypothetical protein